MCLTTSHSSGCRTLRFFLPVFYWENKVALFSSKNVSIPVGVSVFHDEFYTSPPSWAERAYPKIMYCNKDMKGAHFPVWEQPPTLWSGTWKSFSSLPWAGI